jgi:hypothetical protein
MASRGRDANHDARSATPAQDHPVRTTIPAIGAAQNADGGWPYYPGRSSWTEPTAFSLLSGIALDAASVQRGAGWLKATRNSDGGWSPQPKVGPSTWVTALVALLPETLIGGEAHHGAITWLIEQTGQESSLAHRVRQWMLGNQDLSQGAERGWPWFPGAAAWVMPTAIALLALRKEQKIRPSDSLRVRIESGQQFLLTHSCADGGWNHGSTHALGYESKAYPETTGVALIALRGVKSPVVDHGIAVAEKFIQEDQPAGASWLRLGLRAQGKPVGPAPDPPSSMRLNIVDEALLAISRNTDDLFA